MGKLLVNKIRGIKPQAGGGVLLFLACFFSFVCAFGPIEAKAAPTTTGGNAWSSVYAATAAALSVNVTSSTITPGTGANRLLLVAVHLEKATASATTLDATPTFGGVALTPIADTLATATPQRMQTWMGFLPQASILTGAQAVNFRATSSSGNITGVQIKIAVYTGVDQSTPIVDSDANVAAATSVGLNAATTPLTIAADSITVVAASNGGTAPTLATAQTGGAAFTTQTAASSTTGGFGGYITVSGTNAAAGNYTALTTSYTGTTSTRSSQVAATIKAYVASGDTTKPVMGGFTAPTSSSSLTITGITMSATDNVAVTGYGITESATPPAPSALTSTIPLTSYTASSEGTKTLYAWAKDAAGNVSNVYTPQSCTITLPPKPVRAANWTSVYGAVAYPAGNAGTYTMTAGSNRLLVVAIATTRTTVGTHSVSNVTWGGKPLTLAAGNGSLATIWNHTFIYYLKEADIASATGNTLTATITGGTAYYTRIYAAVYSGVDQTNPVSSSALHESAQVATTAVGPFSPTLTVGAQEQAVEIINLARSTAGTTGRTISTWATGWTTAGQAPTGIVTSGPCQQVYIRDRAVPGSTVNDTSQHAASLASSFKAMAAISIKAAASGLALSTGTTIANKSVYAGDTSVAVDAFNIVAGAADTITNITITGSAATTSANVSAVRVYRKVGSNLATYEAGDLQIASGTFSGNIASLSTNESFAASDARNYIIVYDIAANASPSIANTLNGYVSAITATNVSSLVDPVASSATITIYPTTIIGNGTEPSYQRLYKGSAGVMLDAFTLSHNSALSTDDDTISNVTVTLSPTGISGTGQELSKVREVAIVNATDTVVYGSMTAATTGDTWNIPTPTLVATNALANYYVRIKTAANINPGYYTVGGLVTSVVHSKGTSKLVNNDTTSQTHNIDVEEPEEVGNLSISMSTQPGGKIDLSWLAGSDPNGGSLHPTSPYLVVRSAAGGTDPAGYCVPNVGLGDVLLSVGNVTSFTDSGLNDTQAPIYHYRVCVQDALGNVSMGYTGAAPSSYTNYCDQAPEVSLGSEDPMYPGTIQDQIIKSEGGNPFLLQVTNKDIGDCPNVTFNIALVETSTIGGSGPPAPSVNDFSTTYPATVTLGRTAGPGGTNKTGTTESVYIHGLATADQIQKYVFKAQVSAAGHPTVTTAAATGILNDMPPIVHNSNNMAKYQYGTWGNTYTCATCHSNSTTNIKGVYQVISTPIGRRNVVFTQTSAVSGWEGVYSNDQRPVKNVSNEVCSVCHHKTRQHQYSANKPFGGPNNDVPYTSDHHNARDCVRCHTHNTAFRSILGVCGDCHGFKGTGYAPVNRATMVKQLTNAIGTNPPTWGAHQRHNTAKITCSACHNNTNHGMSIDYWAGDNLLEIGFKVDSATFPGFNPAASSTGGTFNGTQNLNSPYVWTPGPNTTINTVPDYNASCNVYCHGGWSGNIGSNTTPNWVGFGQAACGTCHNATLVSPPESGSHLKHAGNGATGLGIACTKCHSTYANYTGSAHINGNVEWNLSQVSPTAAYNGSNASSTGAPAPTDPLAYKTCTNLYCHSNVQGAEGGGHGGPTSYASPIWGDNGDDSGTVFCGSCHIYPNTVGGHAQHENETFALTCQVCHNNGGRTSPLNHANGTIDFQFVGLGMNTVYSKGNTVTPGLGYGTCSSSDCHGRYTREWAPPTATPLCEKCHGSATSARGFYNTRGPDGTLSIYSAAIGVHDIHLQNPNSPRKSTFSRFTSFAVGMHCNQCHFNPTGPFSAGHIDSALPAEVPFTHMSSIAHTGDAFGYYSTPTFTSATQTCNSVWCHGSGMQSNTARGKYAGKTPVSLTPPKWNLPILATGNACTKCHAMPPAASSSADTHWNVGAGRAFTLNECVGCHQHLNSSATGFVNKSLHINGVVDGGCTGCHGDPPTTSAIGTETGLATPAQNALQPGQSGAHLAHMNNVNIQKNCYTCHYNYNPTMPSNNLEIGFNGLGGKVTSGTFTGYTNSVNGPKWVANSAPGGTTTITKVNGTAGQEANICSNLYCHGSTIVSGTNKAPDWTGAEQAACGTCHGADPSSVPFPALNGAHSRHASSSVTLGKPGLGLACETCHGASTLNMTHVDGNVEWLLNKDNPKIGSAARYYNLSAGSTGAVAPSATYRNCTNFYCHSNVQGAGGVGAPTSYKTVTWGSNPGLTCASCHTDMTSSGTGSHIGHTQNGYTCGYCHHDNGAGSEFHADGTIYVNITTSIKGPAAYSGYGRTAGSAAGYGTCSNVICHGAATLTWGQNLGTVQCQKCHGSKSAPFATITSAQVAPGYGADGIATDGSTAATSRRVGAHQRHLSSNVLTSAVKCSECHVKVTSVTANGHLNYTTATLTFSGRATGNGDVATATRNASGIVTCSTTWCHTASRNTGDATVTWTDTAYVNEAGTTVGDCSTACHAIPPKPVSNPITDHDSITTAAGDSISTLGTKCASCHDNIKASPTSVSDVFINKNLHINGSVEGGSCLGCHSSVKGTAPWQRAAVVSQFGFQSHHIQGSEPLTNAQCYNCHMEADASGNTTSYHSKTTKASVDLVVWGAGVRGTSYIAYTANGSRSQISKLNSHCMSCHNTPNQAIRPFGKYSTHRYSPEAKLAAAKPKTSIQSRYSSTRTVAWSNYAFTNSSGNASQFGTNEKKKITKALSAHGNAIKNQFPQWDAAANGKGEDETMADAASATLGSNRNVFCYDCHNSHGSDAAGITSSYSSATGRYKGGLLKSTIAGQGGYSVTYKPAERTITYRQYSAAGTVNAIFNSGASICNDCHNNDTRKVNINRPWSITGTYSSAKAIVGYWSTPYFDNYTVASAKRTLYKQGGAVGTNKDMRKPMGGHYGSSIDATRGGQAGHTGEINGLCTPCHDPHGVSNALGADRDHGVPLLKGTWVTSPYREDRADVAVKRGGGSKWAGVTGAGATPGYHIDQNTLLAMPAPLNGGAATATSRSNKRAQAFRNISNNALKLHTEKTPTEFAGLCLECHNQTTLTGAAAATTTQAWMSKERVHQSVAGWGPTNGTNVGNKVHAYTCSKCHAPHVSRLPRLMVTNCLDVRHFQQRVSGGVISTTSGTTASSYGNFAQTTLTSTALGAGRFPGGGTRYSGTPASAQNPGGWWFQTNNPTNVQPTVQSFGSNCHNAAGAGGAAYDPTKQIWNKKTRW